MATDPPADLVLTPTRGKPRTVTEQLTTFHLLFVAVHAFNERSRWIVPTAANILTDYEQADCRVAWLVVGGGGDEAKRLLGHWAEDILTFVDPDLSAYRAFGLSSLPAIVHLGMDGKVVNAVEGWDPVAWRNLTIVLSKIVAWSRPVIPRATDPGPFAGAPVRA